MIVIKGSAWGCCFLDIVKPFDPSISTEPGLLLGLRAAHFKIFFIFIFHFIFYFYFLIRDFIESSSKSGDSRIEPMPERLMVPKVSHAYSHGRIKDN